MRMKVKNNFYFLFAILSLFFINFLSFSESKPVTTIESLPVREKAEMNIEVTKVISEKIKGKINLEEKTISLDFTEMNERVAKSRMRINEEDYEIFFIENLDSLPTYSNSGVGANSKNKKGVKYNYKVVENNGKKKIKIDYTERPETLYMVVIDKRSGSLVKVFNISNFEEEEVETHATVSNSIAGSYMWYTYNNENCVIQDFGRDTASVLESCTDVRVYQNGSSTGGSFPAIAVGSGWVNTNTILSVTTSLPTFNYTNGSNVVLTTVFLSNPRYVAGGNYYKRYLNSSDPERAKVYGNYAVNATESITAKLNMEISADALKIVRKIAGESVTLSNNTPISGTGSVEQLRLIYAQRSGTAYNLPRGGNTTNNISTYSRAFKYPNITLKKINMENNIVLNFKSGYAENTALSFNEAGTTGYTINQLEVVKTGNQPNYFMTGLASEGTVEFRRDGFTTGVVLGTKSVSTTGVITATSLALTGKNGSTANLSLNYRAGGLATVRVVNWTGEDEYDLYIVHKEASGLARRKYKVTIKTPAYYVTTGGSIGVNNNFTFSQSFRSLEIQDFMDESPTLVNEVGNILGRQNTSMYPTISFPIIAVGGNWTRSATSAVLTGVSVVSANFSKDSNSEKIPIEIYLKDARSTANETSGLVTYKHVISGNGTTSERGRVYGTYYNSSTSEQITANMVMQFPSDILTRIRKINSAEFILNGEGTDQITYAISEYKNNNTYTVPIANTDTYVTKRNYPSIHVEKEIVANNIALEFHKEYIKGREVVFSSSGETTEPHITKRVTEGTNSSHFNPNYFMTGTPFVGTINISGSGLNNGNGINIPVRALGVTDEQTLNLSQGGKTATLKLKYETNGTVKMSLASWSGEGEFPIQIQHREESTLVRRTYNVTIKTPTAFEFVSATNLDFGTIIKGFTGDTATDTIIVKGLGSDGLILIPEDENIDLENGDSKITAGEFKISESSKRNGEETYILTGAIVDSSEATISGIHTGTLQLNVGLAPQTKVSTPK